MGRKVVHGVSFTFLGIFLRTVLTIGSTAFLARLLTPADFGLIAMTTVVTELAALFGNFGFGSVLIQQQRITRLQLDTVFWSSLLLGVFLTICVFALSFLSSWFFQEEMVGELLRVVCLVFLIESVGISHNSVLTRLMKFRMIFWIDLIAIIIRVSTAVTLAWQGYGVWSLVIGSLVGAAIKPATELALVRYWPRVRFNYEYLRTTWKTNASYFGNGFLFYANTNLDLILIGRILGASALGYYQNARSLTDEVRYRVAVPLQRVLFPAFSSLQTDQKRLQETVLKSGRMLAAIIIPLGIGIATVADELVPVLYGDQWLAMIPILKLLGLSTAIKGSCTFATPLYNSQNKVSLSLRYHIIATMIITGSIAITIPWGLTAVAGAITFTALTSIVIYQRGLKLIGLGWQGQIGRAHV